MADFTTLIAILIPALPFLAAFWIAAGIATGRNRGESGEPDTARASLWSIFTALLALLFLDGLAIFGSVQGEIVIGNWFQSSNFQVQISLLFDRLSLTVATLVAFISFLVTRFSIHYLHREQGFQRFMLILSLFNAAMLLIVLAGSATLTFVGWELAGVSSFLLIGYARERRIATGNANRAFLTNRIGDAGFILGIAYAFIIIGTTRWQGIFSAIENNQFNTLSLGIILLGFIMAALAKSAQFPFSDWISRALEGPTPSSAVFYGAVMIHAGIYLLLRLEPLLVQVPVLLIMLAGIGAITAVYAYLSGLAQSDIKSILIFSTLSQTGLMLIWIGFGWFQLALIHLIAHALWRCYQFLSAPSWLQMVTRHTRPVPDWLASNTRLHTAALQRFWLDGFANWLLVNPTKSLAHEAQLFDELVLLRIMGRPTQTGLLSTLSHWESSQRSGYTRPSSVGKGSGILGKITESVASSLQWFEEHLVLRNDSDNLNRLLRTLGRYLEIIDHLLEQPRYLLLLIVATFVVVL